MPYQALLFLELAIVVIGVIAFCFYTVKKLHSLLEARDTEIEKLRQRIERLVSSNANTPQTTSFSSEPETTPAEPSAPSGVVSETGAQNERQDFDQLTTILSSLNVLDVTKLGDQYSESMNIMQSLSAITDPGAYEAWMEQHKHTVNALIASRANAENNILGLREKLEQSKKAIGALEAKLRFWKFQAAAAKNEDKTSGAVTTENKRLRDRTNILEIQLKEKTKILDKVYKELTNTKLEQEKLRSHFNQQLEAMQADLTNANDSLMRSQREKEQIENAFLETDAAYFQEKNAAAELEKNKT